MLLASLAAPAAPAVVRALSIGGGPGFDDVALRLVAGFLNKDGRGTQTAAAEGFNTGCTGNNGGSTNSGGGSTGSAGGSTGRDRNGGDAAAAGRGVPNAATMIPAPPPPPPAPVSPAHRHQEVRVDTLVLDLFEKNWADAVASVSTATTAAMKLGQVGTAAAADCPRLAHCDITLPLDSPCGANVALATGLAAADFLIFSFVLHENAVGLLTAADVDGGGSGASSGSGGSAAADEIGGVLPGLFAGARIGAVMICLDAGRLKCTPVCPT